jgi:hypothetical protein
MVRRDVARHRQAGRLGATDVLERGGRGYVREVQSRRGVGRCVGDRVLEQGQRARHRAGFRAGGPAMEAEDARRQPIVRLRLSRQGAVLGVLDDRSPETSGVQQRVAQQRCVRNRGTVIAERHGAGVRELPERCQDRTRAPDRRRAERQHANGRP